MQKVITTAARTRTVKPSSPSKNRNRYLVVPIAGTKFLEGSAGTYSILKIPYANLIEQKTRLAIMGIRIGTTLKY